MKRIYFLTPNIEITKQIVDELLLSRIEEKHIHIIAKQNVSLQDLPEASFLQKTDFLPALEQGIALGGAVGLVGGLIALALPTGLVLGGGAVLAITLAGAGVGGLMSSMAGAAFSSRRIQKFQDAIENGEILMMVDTPWDRVTEIEEVIKKHHPEAECEGIDPHVFP
ncbi:DUF1269 domain-containing protein [Methylococcus sp. ANG]|uniref:DUF1269 domain-containing protein n=1 Tax=unclassified Methylococcus TaxID=2618889 RepID=UPI001C53088C|nr:DUF1269 domain-containing protein [Methylococcus sp. Mc7]QXP85223.1 DUF1269 domain-containing protein [Methylococcus sp. Mc7]